jgi:NTP pyrophosphatase (non-canonical NTP hydrolase)
VVQNPKADNTRIFGSSNFYQHLQRSEFNNFEPPTLNFYSMDISALQKIVKDRYFETDNARGIYHTALWFHEEVGELSSAIASGDKQNAKEEFADVLMWLLTLANLMDIDMEEVVATYLNNPGKLPSK